MCVYCRGGGGERVEPYTQPVTPTRAFPFQEEKKVSVVTMTPRITGGEGMPRGCGRRRWQGFLDEAVAGRVYYRVELVGDIQTRVILSGGYHLTDAGEGAGLTGNSDWKAKWKAWYTASSWVDSMSSKWPR